MLLLFQPILKHSFKQNMLKLMIKINHSLDFDKLAPTILNPCRGACYDIITFTSSFCILKMQLILP